MPKKAKAKGDAQAQIQNGDMALSGTEEYLNLWLFDGVDYDRQISGRGDSIIVWDPSQENVPAHWERENITSNEDTDVPAGFVVRVINAWIKFI